MIRYLTVAEIAILYVKPQGTVRWLAHRDNWRRSADGRKPVLYSAEDVEKTMDAMTEPRYTRERLGVWLDDLPST